MAKISLEGRIALVTGSGGGMGRSHAVLLAERGADVIVQDIKAEGIAETAELVRATGRRAHAVRADIRDVPALQAAIAEAAAGFGAPDILVNNAGVGGKRRTIEDVDVEIFDQMFDVHVRGTFFATQAVLPAMIERHYGRIVNISSIYAMGGSALASHYAAAKSAISRLHQVLGARACAAPHYRQRGGARVRGDRDDHGQQHRGPDPRARGNHAARPLYRAAGHLLRGGLARVERVRGDHRPSHQPQ